MAIIGISALLAAVVVVVGDIIWRRLVGGSFIGSVDLTQLSVMAAVSWSIPYAFSTSGHVRVDLLNNSLGPKAKLNLDVSASLVGAVVTFFLCWLGAQRGWEVWTYGDVSQDLAIPIILYWVFLLSGLAISAVVCLVRAVQLMAQRLE